MLEIVCAPRIVDDTQIPYFNKVLIISAT